MLVVGGGAVGCAVAWTLARERVSVTLIERDDLARHASGAAAGMLRPLGEMRDNGPFFEWGLRSLGMFPPLVAELRERSGIDPEFVESGVLDVATRESEAEALREKALGLAAYDVVWLDAAEARAAEPQLRADALGALWSPREAHVRSPQLARAFAAAAAGLGARIETGVDALGLLREGVRVTGVETSDGVRPAGHVILCTGAWSSVAAGWADSGAKLPIEPVRGQILSLEGPRPPLRSMLVGEGTYLVPKCDGSVVVGATQERVGFDCRVTAAGMGQLLAAAPRVVPALADASFRFAWAGLRPSTPDGMPLIGPLPGIEGLVIAAGHSRNGVLLCPVTGELVADFVLGKGLPDSAAAFRPDRF